MRIEALQAITIRLPGGELRDLRPGEPVTLPSELAVKLLSKAQGKVRLVATPSPCRLCGADSWWRAGQAEAWQCRRCHPLVRAPGYEVLGPYGKLGDGVKAQPRADGAAWEAAWRELAAVTDGITADDSRFQPVMAALEQCDTAYLAGDWPAFQQAVAQVRLTAQTEHE